MLSTIIRNLTSNALKFTSQGGSVTLSAKQDGTSWEFSVTDTGIGISEEVFPSPSSD
jgi:signal transduction histidine kinase